MRYLDASALVPLIVAESTSPTAQAWLAEDDRIVTWAWSRIEIVGAVERRTRDGALTRGIRRDLLGRLEAFSETWDEVTDLLAVRHQARSLLARHPLRAADAGQLGAALLIAQQLASQLAFVCFDQRLTLAAELEGLRVLEM